MKTGIYSGLSEADYSAIPAIRQSSLKKMLLCPAAYWIESEDTEAMQIGRIADILAFDADVFFDHFVIGPNARGNSTEWKNAAAKAITENKTIIKEQVFDEGLRLAQAIKRDPWGQQLIAAEDTETQTVLVWIDEATGLRLKARLDIVSEDIRVIADMKTMRDASSRGVSNAVLYLRYDIQAAFYLWGYHAVTGIEMDFVFLGVEKKTYLTHTFSLEPHYLSVARRTIDQLLKRYKECQDADSWPHYSDSDITVVRCPNFLDTLELVK